jgi:hypothetical protein
MPQTSSDDNVLVIVGTGGNDSLSCSSTLISYLYGEGGNDTFNFVSNLNKVCNLIGAQNGSNIFRYSSSFVTKGAAPVTIMNYKNGDVIDLTNYQGLNLQNLGISIDKNNSIITLPNAQLIKIRYTINELQIKLNQTYSYFPFKNIPLPDDEASLPALDLTDEDFIPYPSPSSVPSNNALPLEVNEIVLLGLSLLCGYVLVT